MAQRSTSSLGLYWSLQGSSSDWQRWHGTVLEVLAPRKKRKAGCNPKSKQEIIVSVDQSSSRDQASPAIDSQSKSGRKSYKRPTLAIKILHPWTVKPTDFKRFLREQSALARIQHPNVARYIGSGVHEGQPYLVMQYIPGRTLAELMRDADEQPGVHRYSLETRLSWFRMICEGVAAAHQQLILHRDLKPGNIIINPENQAVLTDFGLAKDLGAEEIHSKISSTGRLMGTLPYMSPEQIQGDRQLQLSSDVYGLGAVLYYLLTGRPPHRGKNFPELCEAICQATPVSPQKLNPQIPRDLETICLCCINKTPTRRYSSAEQLREDLDRYLGGHPIQARPVSSLERSVYWAKRRPAIAALTGSMLIGGLASLITFAWLWSDAVASRDMANQRNTQLLNTIEDLAQLLRSVEEDPSTLRVQGEMLRTIANGYDRMAADGPLESHILHDAGVAWFKLGRVENQLGDAAAKMQSYRQAEYYFREVLRQGSEELSDQFDLFHSLTSQGRDQESHELIQEIVNRDTTQNLYYLDALSDSYRKVARQKLNQRLFDESLPISQRGLKIAQELVTIDPENAHFHRKVGQHFMHQGHIAEGRFEFEASQSVYKQAAQYLDRAQQLQPDDFGILIERNLLFVCLARVGIVLGQFDLARQWQRQAEEVVEYISGKFSGYQSEWECGERTLQSRLQLELASGDDEDIQNARLAYEQLLQSRLAKFSNCETALLQVEWLATDPGVNPQR